MPAATSSPSSARTSPALLRYDIAYGKAWGALGMGFGSRTLAGRAAKTPQFFTMLAAASGGRMVTNPGGVLIKDSAGNIIGAFGISGDTSDKDEICAVAGIEAAGLKADPGAVVLFPPPGTPKGW